MTCKDCIHYEACKGTYYEVKEQGEFDGEMYAECGCDDFKNKADFVEVVRCRDCKHWLKKVFDPISKRHIGSCDCKQWQNDYFWYKTCDTDFCSYGERK